MMRIARLAGCIRLCMILSWAAWLCLVAKFFHASNVMRHLLFQDGLTQPPIHIQPKAQRQPPRSNIQSLSLPNAYVKMTSMSSTSSISTPTVFEPGSLDMEKHDTIAKCWIASPRHQDQRIKTPQNCLYSSQYHLSASLSGKTGTSTQKKVLQSTMNAKEVPCDTIPNDGALVQVATVREPLDRFISGYKETLFRERVYSSDPDVQNLPNEYSRFLSILQNKSEEEKQAIFRAETPHLLHLKTQMFEIFVNDYDGEHIFDRHLNAQTIKLWDPHGLGMARYDYIMESANLTQDLAFVASWVGAPPYPTEVKARSRVSDRIDLESLKNETIQKICQLFALDYCCLNYELPPACQRAPIGQRVRCEWVSQADPQGKVTMQIRNVWG